MNNPKVGDLMVFHIPQVPMKSFNVDVKNIEEAKKILTVLANYDIFQFENHVKGDYCNIGGLLVYEGNEESVEEDLPGWCDWYDEEGNTIDDLMLKDREKL